MPDPLSLIPQGDQYNVLRWTLQHLKALDDAGYGTNYAGLFNQPGRIEGWVKEIDSPDGRDADQIRDDIVQYIIGPELAQEAYGLDEEGFQQLILGGNEGGINLGEQTIIPKTAPTPEPTPEPPPPTAPPPPPPDPTIPDPTVPDPTDSGTPQPEPEPEPEPIDYRAQAQALYPHLPAPLIEEFANAWASTGDRALALAEVRQSSQYDNFFPGIRRSDGTLRMTELEYLSRKDGYRMALSQFNINPSNFENRFVEMIEGEVTVQQFASRLSSAYEQIITALPEVREFYSSEFGIPMTDEAVFASFIDPELGESILNRRIAISQIGGAGAASGFDIDLELADRLRQRGIGFGGAQELFGDAAFRIPTLNALAGRHGVDKDVDLGEFLQASAFRDPRQRRRFQQLMASERSQFSEQFGTIRTSQNLGLEGLRQR